MPTPLPPGDYLFTHLLTRDAAYHALLRRSRIALHSAAADALEALLQPGAPDELVRLGMLQRHLEHSERWREAHRYCCRALSSRAMQGYTAGWEDAAQRAGYLWWQARREDPGLPERSAHELNAWSFYLTVTGRIAEAKQRALQALELARAAVDRVQESGALNYYGMACQHSGEFHHALDYFQQALDIYRELGSERDVLRGLNNTGLALLYTGESERARANLRQALELARKLDDSLMQGNLELNVGGAERDLGDLAAARGHFERALAISRGMGDLQTEAAALACLCGLERNAQRLDEAAALGNCALDIAERIAMPTMAVFCLTQLGQVASSRGDHGQARRQVRRAVELARDCGDRAQEVEALLLAAVIEHAAGAGGAARAALDHAVETAHVYGLDSLPSYLEQRAEVRAALGLPHAAA